MKKFLMSLLVIVVVIAPMISTTSAYKITGVDWSTRHSESYVKYGSKVFGIKEGKTLFLPADNICSVIHRNEFGWSETKQKPIKQIKINFHSMNAVLRPKPVILVITSFYSRRKVMLNYPPVSSPWHLPVGISQLTGILRSNGHEVLQRYGHIIGLEYVLRRQNCEEIDNALRVVRDTSSSIESLYAARKIFEKTSSDIATKDKFLVSGNNVSYVSVNYDGTIEGVLRAIASRDTNMWHNYFSEVEVPLALGYKPDVYGISIADERQLIQGCILASMIKEILPDTLVVMGGNFWSRVNKAYNDPKFLELFQYFDAVCLKEGYQPMKKMVETLNPSETPGAVWNNNSKIVINCSPVTPTSFEELPFASYDDGGANQWSSDHVIPLYTSSNCPTACSFCAISAGSDTFLKSPRVMSSKRVVEHMIASGEHRFDISDETFTIARQLALGDELKRVGYNATWQCYLNVTNQMLNPNVAIQLYDAGCRAVQLGLETLSPETLEREHKNWNCPENYGKILQNLKLAGIQTHVFIIVGLPGEPLHSTLHWLPFLEDYGENILTIKSSRYRLACMSPEAIEGNHSKSIDVEDNKPFHLNMDFTYKQTSRKKVEAMRDLMEEVCRHHWAYSVTTTIPWWANRGRYTLEQLQAMSKKLSQESESTHFYRSLAKISTIVREELGQNVQLKSYEDVLKFSKTI